MSSPSSSQVSLTGANVIKWTEVLPGFRNMAAAPSAKGIHTGAAARRRQRRAPGPPPGAWPLPGSRPTGPLPDPALARLCAVPDAAPPYDDQIQRNDRVQEDQNAGGPPAVVRGDSQAQADSSTRQNLRPDRRARPEGGAEPDRRARADRSTRQNHATQPDSGAQPDDASRADAAARADARPGADTGDPVRQLWPSQFAQVLAETLAGSRPPRQLTPWTTQRARGHIRRLGPLLAANQEPRIRRIVASTPARGVVEMAVVVHFGARVHALAVRLERAETAHPSAWQCTAIEAA
jgi:Family of unknown function (DUF6459)